VAARRRLDGLSAALYWACDSGQTLGALHTRFAAQWSPDLIAQVLRLLVEARLMVYLDGKYLSLAVFRGRRTANCEWEKAEHEAALA
jgi:hypothetical protein